jgi:hypothetical protein
MTIHADEPGDLGGDDGDDVMLLLMTNFVEATCLVAAVGSRKIC